MRRTRSTGLYECCAPIRFVPFGGTARFPCRKLVEVNDRTYRQIGLDFSWKFVSQAPQKMKRRPHVPEKFQLQ